MKIFLYGKLKWNEIIESHAKSQEKRKTFSESTCIKRREGEMWMGNTKKTIRPSQPFPDVPTKEGKSTYTKTLIFYCIRCYMVYNSQVIFHIFCA